MRKLALAVATAAVLGLFAGSAGAQDNIPSSKAIYGLGNIQLMTSAAADPSNPGPNVDEKGWLTVMTVQLKTANNKEIAMDLSAVCKLWNENQTSSKGGNKETSKTKNKLELKIEVETFKNGVSQGFATVIPDMVVYCEQAVELSATFQGIFQTDTEETFDEEILADGIGNDDGLCDSIEKALGGCVENDGDGIGDNDGVCEVIDDTFGSDTDPAEEDEVCETITLVGTCLFLDPDTGLIFLDEECLTPEEIALVLHTVEANAFNWLAVNVQSGVQVIRVMARIASEAEVLADEGFMDDSTTGALAKAVLGKLALFAEEVRLINSLQTGDLTCDNSLKVVSASSPSPEWCTPDDLDGDGVHDGPDNCLLVANGLDEDDQADGDGDGVGAACDANDAKKFVGIAECADGVDNADADGKQDAAGVVGNTPDPECASPTDNDESA